MYGGANGGLCGSDGGVGCCSGEGDGASVLGLFVLQDLTGLFSWWEGIARVGVSMRLYLSSTHRVLISSEKARRRRHDPCLDAWEWTLRLLVPTRVRE